ncbi:unnamed protein product [Moneuplotes crassus]|uniref:Cation efflux protein transmembrane domain-containing protein n=1 Tax=Euplotes crassus TaxID=5936 RepID=A0AAD1UV08_EUPCR|nr:unnamed protein product [Moneuplotes crassus]
MRDGIRFNDKLESMKGKFNGSHPWIKKLIFVIIVCSIYLLIELWRRDQYNDRYVCLIIRLIGFSISLFTIRAILIGGNTRRRTFGNDRLEVLGALGTVLIWCLSVLLIIDAVGRIMNPIKLDSASMMFTALLGLFFNFIMLKILTMQETEADNKPSQEQLSYEMQDLGLEGLEFNGAPKVENESLVLKMHDSLDQQPEMRESIGSKSFYVDTESQKDSEFEDINTHKNQSGGNSKDYLGALKSIFNKDKMPKLEYNVSDSLNVRAAAVHVFSDIIQSLKNLTVAISIHSLPEATLIEPICTIVFSILGLFTTYFILKDCINILMEGVPKNMSYREVKTSIERIKGIISVKTLHVWSITPNRACLTAKIIARVNTPVVMQAHEICRKKFGIQECFIEVNTI